MPAHFEGKGYGLTDHVLFQIPDKLIPEECPDYDFVIMIQSIPINSFQQLNFLFGIYTYVSIIHIN